MIDYQVYSHSRLRFGMHRAAEIRHSCTSSLQEQGRKDATSAKQRTLDRIPWSAYPILVRENTETEQIRDQIIPQIKSFIRIRKGMAGEGNISLYKEDATIETIDSSPHTIFERIPCGFPEIICLVPSISFFAVLFLFQVDRKLWYRYTCRKILLQNKIFNYQNIIKGQVVWFQCWILF